MKVRNTMSYNYDEFFNNYLRQKLKTRTEQKKRKKLVNKSSILCFLSTYDKIDLFYFSNSSFPPQFENYNIAILHAINILFPYPGQIKNNHDMATKIWLYS